MITVRDLRKSFKIAKRKAGVTAAVASLFRRKIYYYQSNVRHPYAGWREDCQKRNRFRQ